MVRYSVLSLLLAATFLLSSCSLGGARNGIFDNSSTIADARLEQLLEAISSKDKDALQAQFSKQALSEADDFDGDTEELFRYVKGDVQSWERLGGSAGGHEETDGKGNRKKRIDSKYMFTTTEGKYHVAVYEWTIDTYNPDNVGVYSFCIIDAEERQDSTRAYWGNKEAGINIGQ